MVTYENAKQVDNIFEYRSTEIKSTNSYNYFQFFIILIQLNNANKNHISIHTVIYYIYIV